jgi:kynurenine formamidase
MTVRLLKGAIAIIGLSLGAAGAAGVVVNGYWSQPPASQAQPPAGQAPDTGGQRGGGGRGRGAATLLSPGPSAARFPRNADEFDQMFNQVKNWGRWGPNDQLGAANLITDAKRKQAIGLAKQGIVIGLAHSPITEMAPDNTSPFEHTMNRGFTTDTYKVSYHGYAHSHIDALCHFSYKGQTYNGYAVADVNTAKGCMKLGIENLRNGIVTRGVLIDIPRLKGLPWLEPGTPVFVEDIEAWEKKAGVKVGPGDAIFLRTGRWARRAQLGPWAVGQNEAGYHASVAPWLKARGVSFLASDDAQDVTPALVDGVNLPVHTLAIAGLGVDIMDNQDLEAVAETAVKLNRWEFLLTVAPVPVIGGTGFPANALAIF